MDLIFHLDRVCCIASRCSRGACPASVFTVTRSVCLSLLCWPAQQIALLTPPLFQVHFVLDEVVMGGMVLETNLGDIREAITAQNKHEKGDSTLGNLKDVFSRSK